jgi:c-di-GMP-binding flagellar brake protein YcgR
VSDALPAEHITRAPQEIARVLELLASRGTPLLSHVARGTMQFVSRLRQIDPGLRHIVVDASADDLANEALVSRLRAIFCATVGERYFEFAASNAARLEHDGRPLIRLDFPDVLASYARRADPRVAVSPPLHCLADASGDMPFDAEVIDISSGGIGLLYPADISLEPGTILKGCVVTGLRMAPSIFDLEVRYSQVALLSEREHTQRSGCRFVDPAAPNVRQLVAVCAAKGPGAARAPTHEESKP